MAVTASRLGSAPLTLDWSHLVRRFETRKYPDDPDLPRQIWIRLKRRLHLEDVGFYDSPIQNEISQATECQELADRLLSRDLFTDVLVLGIGGSALGPMSLLSALVEKRQTRIQFHFMENPDPLDWKTTLSKLRAESTLVLSITKSGTTFETLAQTLLALEWLGKSRWKSHLVILTDPEKGDLRALAKQEGIPSLSIVPSIGGRFSVFSPVGLFPAALAGLSIPAFLSGAKQVRDFTEKTPHEKNPLFILGQECVHNYPKRPIHVFMPYSTRLRSFGNWFVQLWAESLGKEGKGFTPVAAMGATDQHSILQLLRDGPDDKITFFLTVDQVPDEVKIPEGLTLPNPSQRTFPFPAFKILEGHSLNELLHTEYRATSLVLTRQSRPHIALGLDRLDERSMGALYFAFMVLTAYTGTLWNIDPFNQPGVEEGKIYIRESLEKQAESPPLIL